MKFPCELLAEPYIAQLRIEIAHLLHRQDYTQNQIANLLQVSQPVVSGYLKKSKYNADLPDTIVSRAKIVAHDITSILQAKGIAGTEEAIARGCHDCKIMRQAGPTCIYHKSITSNLADDCTSCLTKEPLIQLQVDKQSVLRDLSQLFSLLKSKPQIDQIIPEIGMQIIHSIEHPSSMSDIGAFPGRIIKRVGALPLASPPSFGSSETTSQLLLDLRSRGIVIRTIAAIKTNRYLENRLATLDLDIFEVSGFEENMSDKLAELDLNDSSLLLVGRDSVGYESISYVCCKNINELEVTLLDLLR